MKSWLMYVVVLIILSAPVGASEVDLFPTLDMDKSGEISISEFDAFIEQIMEQKIKDMNIFADLSADAPQIRVYKEEMIKTMLNGTKHFFEMQDKNGDLLITREEYNNSLFQPLLKIGE